MASDSDDKYSKECFFIETKRHKLCLMFRGYRYVQDKIQNRTIYWRCEDRTHCNGRAHQLVYDGSLPILTMKHNHQPIADSFNVNMTTALSGQCRQQQPQNPQMFRNHKNNDDDLLLSSASSTMTSPIKLENHQNRQQHLSQNGTMMKNLHLSEVITTVAANNSHHYNGTGMHRPNTVDPIEMTKLLSNITTSTSSPSKPISTSPNMDCLSRLNQFAWEEIEGRCVPVIFRSEGDGLQRYTSKMYVENTLFQSESWQRHAILARSLPPLISFPYTENELKLFRIIVQWHLACFQFKTILPSDCLIRFDDLLDFYSALKKLRDTVSTSSYNRPLPIPRPLAPPPLPPPSLHPGIVSIAPPKHHMNPLLSSQSNNIPQSFELPTMVGNSSMKSHTQNRHSMPPKIYPPPTLQNPHSINYSLQQNTDLIPPYSNQAGQSFNFTSVPPKSSVPPFSSPSQWNEAFLKNNDKTRPPLPRPVISMNNNFSQEQAMSDKRTLTTKRIHSPVDKSEQPKEVKEPGWVQINNVFVPYIVKTKMRENEPDKNSIRQSTSSQVQYEYYVPYEILIKCHIFSDNDFAFKKLLIKATLQDFTTFNSLMSNINIFDEKVPEKTLLVNLHHVMMGLQKIIYVKFLTTKHPRTQVNKYHSEVLIHKGGALLMHGNKLVPYIVQNNRFYVPIIYAYHSFSNALSQAKRGARAPRQYEIDYLNLLFIYFSIDAPPLTSDTLLVDAFSIKSSDLQPPIHFRTLSEHHQNERNRLLSKISILPQANSKLPQQQQQTIKSNPVTNTSNNKINKRPPANVVVNPMIHHPSFYGLSAQSTSIQKQGGASSSSSSVVVNPLLLPSTKNSDLLTKTSSKPCQIKSIKHDNHLLNCIVKSDDIPVNDWKISIKHIFKEYLFDIDLNKFIGWSQTNLLLPLLRLDDAEKQFIQKYLDDDDVYYIHYRHLDRCISLLNDLKRGAISMTLLSSTNNELQSTSMKSQLAGAKKRKTTMPTTRHISTPIQPSSPSMATSNFNESDTANPENNDHLSPELTTNQESTLFNENSLMNDHDNDNQMPIVASIEEEQPIQESNRLSRSTSFLIVDSNECDDGKIHLDDTLPSCSSGYESAPPITNYDILTTNDPSSDDDDNDDDREVNSIVRLRKNSSSCQSEQSLTPMFTNVSSNLEDELRSSPVITNQKSNSRQRDRYGKFRTRSRSPTPKFVKKKRSSDEQIPTANTITSDQIELHLRTLLMPVNEQRRTRTRPIKTPTRLVDEISLNNSHKVTEADTNHIDTRSTSPITTKNTADSSNSNESNLNNHQLCTYNVTISNKPNKLGLTIKKIVQK